MKIKNFEELISKIKTSYSENEMDIIKKAYYYAEHLHRGQKRQSGEDYIIHPLNVAYILFSLNADCNTLCAGLLHDTIEDSNIKKEQIAEEFNYVVSLLVDGVTKISKINFDRKDEHNLANTKKIISSMTEDVRIIIIKLADRLHNMRTLQYKNILKQKENSLETLEIYVPLAYYIGAYEIKNELEDLSLKYLKQDLYQNIETLRNDIMNKNKDEFNSVLDNINSILNNKNIRSCCKIRIKNIYSIYKKISEGYKLCDIHDLIAIKVIVNSVDDCYRSLGLIHNIYKPINSKFKDYICAKKTNMYSSLHTTIFTNTDYLIQVQIRTEEMDKVAAHGITEYWNLHGNDARNLM